MADHVTTPTFTAEQYLSMASIYATGSAVRVMLEDAATMAKENALLSAKMETMDDYTQRAARQVTRALATAEKYAADVQRLDSECNEWMLVVDGVKHDPRCKNNMASGGGGDTECLRCQVQRLTDEIETRKMAERSMLAQLMELGRGTK